MQIEELMIKLENQKWLEKAEWIQLIEGRTEQTSQFLFERAREIRNRYYGNEIYVRGLIEFTNYCKNDCFYCGIRKSNQDAIRYRLSLEEIMECCATGYALGFRTFVLQGGEDPYYSKNRMVEIISTIRKQYEDCAITLSIGEKDYDEYKAYYQAGADRYLLRHETADETHYQSLHPQSLSLENRKKCLWDLKEIGFQVGTGFMIGSPNQTSQSLARDMMFISELKPHMIGIGPFISHHKTPFSDEINGTLEETLYFIGLLRLLRPGCLIPATTALGTIDPRGREKGIQAGANVVMPNLSPVSVRKKYDLYDNKICTGDEAAECRNCLTQRMQNIGHQIVISRGDYKGE
ncbi:[FeFe] hydrogenase H-cluster radical SAM maturase HydE [Anaerosacchariphilus polymeriproducens]|nr:[FeFe] hydrogenase H-cluster radical SAM maturase HydE [Anaerosacchariphilus polymeriproducens]